MRISTTASAVTTTTANSASPLCLYSPDCVEGSLQHHLARLWATLAVERGRERGMLATDGPAGPAIAGWSRALGKLHRRIGHRFARSEARERVKRYLVGLLGMAERKNGWQMAEAIGERDPQGVQRLLNVAKWDAELVRDDLREYVVEHLAEEATGVLIVDETGFLKKGEKSVGVARGPRVLTGDTVNCQVGVFVAYASEKGAAFLNRALSIYQRRGRTPPP